MTEIKKESLISGDFFPEGIKVDETRIFPMVVIANMSSGKSTLINALLGKDILPNSNAACTALNYSILDDDQDTKEIICATDLNGKINVIEENLAEELAKLNQDRNISDVFIRSHINGIINTDKALLVIDTPGPNNSRDASHEEIFYKIVNKIEGGLFLYVLNASQIAVNDDKNLLLSLKKIIDKKPNIKIIFAINKIDVIDEEYESVEEFMQIAKSYLTDFGFEQIEIIPVSAMAAILFKKVLAGENLTRMEYANFIDLYELFEPKDYCMRKYVITSDINQQNKEIELKGKKYKVRDLNQAINNTGIKALEECIQKAQILSSERIKNTIKVKL